LLDHVAAFNEQHLQHLLRDYVAYYNAERILTKLKDAPAGRSTETRPPADARAAGPAHVGALHHR